MNNKKITILIVSYNQENLIGRALDSVLKQREFGLYEIVVGDDCSTDHTWDVLLEYQKRFPQIVRPIHNDHNLGIYGNMLNVHAHRGDADLFLDMAGDDCLCSGYFEAVQKFILQDNIDTGKAIGIYAAWKEILPDGKERVHSQKFVKQGYNLWSLFLRDFICGRSLMVSEKVLCEFDCIVLDKGLGLAELIYDSQFHLHIQNAYYLPKVASVYYNGIGVSTKLQNPDWMVRQARIKMNYATEHYAKDERDRKYIKFCLKKSDFIEKPTIGRFVSMFYYYEKGQLRGCRRSIKYTWLLFGSMFKKYLLGF